MLSDSSLEISPVEQITFLNKLTANNLPVTAHAITMTKNNLFVKDLDNGWKLFGKTGNGNLLNEDRTEKLENQVGWFIGWIQNNERTITFVNLIVDDKPHEEYASLRAKDFAISELNHWIKDKK